MIITIFFGLFTLIAGQWQEGYYDCSEGNAGVLLDKVLLSTPTPVMNSDLTIFIAGKQLVTVEPGAKIYARVTKWGRTFFDNTIDYCTSVKARGLHCPLKQSDLENGYFNVESVTRIGQYWLPTRSVDVQLTVWAVNADGSPLYCFSGPLSIYK